MSGLMLDCIIVHLNYNSAQRYGSLFEKALDTLIRSIELAKRGGYEVAVLFADNSSSDDTIYILNEKLKNANFKYEIVKFDKNYGFARGNNKAWRLAQEIFGSTRYVIFINPDVLVDEYWLANLLEFLDKKAPMRVGLVQPLTLPTSLYEHRQYIRNILMTKKNEYVKRKILTGHCVAVEAKLFASLGGWDESFFLYGEDIDLSLRALSMGKNNIIHIRSLIFHEAHLSAFTPAVLADIISRYILMMRYLEWNDLVTMIVKASMYDMLRFVYRLMKSEKTTITSTIKAYLFLLRYIQAFFIQRKQYQKLRRILQQYSFDIVNYFTKNIIISLRKHISSNLIKYSKSYCQKHLRL